MNSTEAKDDMILRLRKIEGQVKGIQKMIAEERPCRDVLTQLIAIRSGIEQVGLMLLDTQIERCLGKGTEVERDTLRVLKQTLRMWTRLN